MSLKDCIKIVLSGAMIGFFIEACVILFIISFGYELELLTIVVTYLFATLISIAIIIEMKND